MAEGMIPNPLPLVTKISDANEIGISLINVKNNMTNVPTSFGNDYVGIINFPIISDDILIGNIQLATVLSQGNVDYKKIYKRRMVDNTWGAWVAIE